MILFTGGIRIHLVFPQRYLFANVFTLCPLAWVYLLAKMFAWRKANSNLKGKDILSWDTYSNISLNYII